MIQDGRISMAGVTSGNVGHLAKAMHDVTKYVSFDKTKHQVSSFWVIITDNVFMNMYF